MKAEGAGKTGELRCPGPLGVIVMDDAGNRRLNYNNVKARRNSNDEGTQSEEEQVPRRPNKPRVIRVHLFGWAFAVAFGLAGYLISFSHKFSLVSILLLTLGVGFAGFAIRLLLINHNWKQRTANLICVLVVASGVTFGLVMLWWEHAQLQAGTETPKPHFKVLLSTSDSPDASLELTNSFLIFNRLPTSDRQVTGDLLVPAKSLNSLPALSFTVVNDSSAYSGPLEIAFDWPTGLSFDADPPWAELKRGSDTNSGFFAGSVACRIDGIFSGNGIKLPFLRLRSCAAISNHLSRPCQIQIMTKDRNDSFIAFWLYVPVTTNIIKPRVVLATNSVFYIPYDIP